ncbi:MAG: TonB family protein [Chryseotalea sp. WA131a]|nr:MAG: TonB family protein [Chryseotalea sp. WA131a]
MRDWKTDIEKYKRGELTPAQMHALEKEALRDPFLADALEGADALDATTFSSDVNELQSKIGSEKKGASWIWPLRIAAGVIIAVSGYLIANQLMPGTKPNDLALENKATTPNESAPTPLGIKTDTSGNGTGAYKSVTKENPSVSTIDQSKNNQPKPPAEIATTKTGVAATQPTENPIALAEKEETDETASEVASPSKAEELELKKAEAEKTERMAALDISSKEKKSIAPAPSLSRAKSFALKTYQGKVTSSEDGSPMPGVNVVIDGTTQGTVTDANGIFEIESPVENPNLVFSFIGLKTKEVKPNDSKLAVALEQDVSQLSEVVVTGYGVSRDENHNPIIKKAEPVGGLKAYNRYLDNDARYPLAELEKKIKGKVSLKFTVRTDGSLDQFNVVKSLGKAFDEEALRMVKEGPTWSPTTEDNVPIESEVLVRVKFDPAKARK